MTQFFNEPIGNSVVHFTVCDVHSVKHFFFVPEKILLSAGQVRVRICQPDLKIHLPLAYYKQPTGFVMLTMLTKYENQYIQIKTGYNYLK